MLTFENLTKGFWVNGNYRVVIDDLDIVLPDGKSLALLGRNGAGKSTLMNQLSKSNVFAEDKLFATLDTTVRKVVFDTMPFLLSDTVGFIRKLPHHLIESFKSTLDEIGRASCRERV